MAAASTGRANGNGKSLESWIWDAACSIRGAKDAPATLYGQEFTPETWAMANMNMIIHDMEGEIEIPDLSVDD